MNSKAELPSSSPRSDATSRAGKFLRRHRIELSLFLCLWLVYGITANSRNQYEFNLQQAGVEAIVERHHFYLEGSATPRLQMRVYYYDGDKPFGDVFLHNGHQYAAKQPGQFMFGAAVYFLLQLLGLDYFHHFFLASALVSFLTTSVVTALAAVAVFATVRELAGEPKLFWPLACALSYGLGTTAFVYAGIAYHDALASGFVAMAFGCAVFLARRAPVGRAAMFLAGSCGLLLGLTVTTSMLPFLLACVIAIYVLWLRRWNLSAALLVGGLLGVAPLLVFNTISFGNPLLNSYIVGGYPESMLHLDLHNSIEKAQLYLKEITYYVPIAWLGILGLLFFPPWLRREQIVISLLLLAQAFQVLNIDSHGGCHYGPRFLLPIMPFVCIGLGGFVFVRSGLIRSLATGAAILLGLVSIIINTAGAIFTAMYCDVDRYAFWPALGNLRGLTLNDFPLAAWLGLPLLVSLILLVRSIRSYPAREVLA